jgi:acetylornithine deacetylase/succinyl-diaminopimelate desuccinylase-like protein
MDQQATPSPAAHRAVDFARSSRARSVADLAEFIRRPSVSAASDGAPVRRCAEWLATHLRQVGISRVKLTPGARHPAVLAATPYRPGRPTVLVYGHYDVQPPEPLAEWRSPPFEPRTDGRYIFGRGASDDKGPVLAYVKALEAWVATSGQPPLNVVLLIDGEEEIGSPGLVPLLERHRHELSADVAVMSDTRMVDAHHPAISYAERGKLDLEIAVSGPRSDLHSGMFGGAVHNPIQVLADLVSSLHDRQGRVAVGGFYDEVRRVSARERAHLRRFGPDDATVLRQAAAPAGWGDPGYSLYERTTIRPAITLNGIRGGYQGPGGKSVIPSTAAVKVNIRLVPDQDPGRIEAQVRAHLRRVAPPTVRVDVRRRAAAAPVVLDRFHPAIAAAGRAYRRGFGAAPVLLRSGGTIPVVALLKDRLHIPTVLMGFSLPGDHIHAPNERFLLDNYMRGIETVVWFLAEIGGSHDHRLPLSCRSR